MANIGRIIRTFRKQRNMTLKDLAAEADISSSYLSQIENDTVNMNISVLENISKALDVPIYMFFIQENIDNISHVRKEARTRVLREDKVEKELLVNPEVFPDDIHIMNIPANYSAKEYAVHQGKEFLLVLSGGLSIDFGGYKTVELGEGDSLAFSSKIPHSISSEDGCRVFVYSTTPPLAFI